MQGRNEADTSALKRHSLWSRMRNFGVRSIPRVLFLLMGNDADKTCSATGLERFRFRSRVFTGGRVHPPSPGFLVTLIYFEV